MNVVLLTSDLMLTSAAQGVVSRNDGLLSLAVSAAEAISACQSTQAAALIVDLKAAGVSFDELADRLRQECAPPPMIYGVGQHVHKRLLDAARDAGFDSVMTRGEFSRQLDEALKATRSA